MSHYVTLMFDVEDLCQTPAIGDSIADEVRAGIAHWPIHDPNIDPERILLHTRLQCWTLRPALAQDEQRRAT